VISTIPAPGAVLNEFAMGTQKDIIFTYDDLDQLWRISLGEHADISAAYYNGDYSKSLDQAQRDKHEWILKGTGFKPGCRVFDIGCGWGPMLKAIKDGGGDGIGLSLSPKQVEVCRQNGLNAILRDWKELQPGELGKFEVVISIGSFEQFCSVEEYFEDKRDKINDVFDTKKGGFNISGGGYTRSNQHRFSCV